MNFKSKNTSIINQFLSTKNKSNYFLVLNKPEYCPPIIYFYHSTHTSYKKSRKQQLNLFRQFYPIDELFHRIEQKLVIINNFY